MKITCVCSKCGNNETENVSIEINFREEKIYWYCPSCKSMNTISLKKDLPPPLPKSRRLGG